jgi:hypothetical protein
MTRAQIMIEAHRLARRRIMDEWLRRGIKRRWDVEAADLAAKARAYVAEHPELIADAMARLGIPPQHR